MPEHDGPAAYCFGDGRVLTLRISGHVNAPAERDAAGVEALRQRRLARAYDPGKHDVRRRDGPSRIEHPRIVDEGCPRVEILSDEDPLRSQSALGEEWVRACERRTRVLVARKAELARRAQSGGAGLARARQVSRRALRIALGFPLGSGLCLVRLAVVGSDSLRRLSPCPSH